MSYASLSLPSRGWSTKLAIISYGYQYTASIQSAQQRLQSSSYPIRAAQTGLNFTVKCRSEAEWTALKDMIKNHQMDLLTSTNVSDAFFRLVWPEQRKDYTFVVKSSPGGTQRFLVAPELAISVDLIYDNLLSQTNEFFDPGSNYDILSGVVDEGEFIKPVVWGDRKPSAVFPGLPVAPGRFDQGGGNGVGGI